MVAGEPNDSDLTSEEKRNQGKTVDSPNHLEVCPRCGQAFDNRLLHQVIYHNQPTHKPVGSQS
jgi:hypothetical protein